jgi:hypothetical protein
VNTRGYSKWTSAIATTGNNPRTANKPGLMQCGICGRRVQGSWNNGRAYYRCRFPAEYAIAKYKHPKTVYLREDAVLTGLDT